MLSEQKRLGRSPSKTNIEEGPVNKVNYHCARKARSANCYTMPYKKYLNLLHINSTIPKDTITVICTNEKWDAMTTTVQHIMQQITNQIIVTSKHYKIIRRWRMGWCKFNSNTTYLFHNTALHNYSRFMLDNSSIQARLVESGICRQVVNRTISKRSRCKYPINNDE